MAGKSTRSIICVLNFCKCQDFAMFDYQRLVGFFMCNTGQYSFGIDLNRLIRLISWALSFCRVFLIHHDLVPGVESRFASLAAPFILCPSKVLATRSTTVFPPWLKNKCRDEWFLDKSALSWHLLLVISSNYPLVNVYITMENHYF